MAWGGPQGPGPQRGLRTVELMPLSVSLPPSSRVTDLVNQQQTLEEKMREDRDSLVERLHRQTAEYSAFKLENERLKVPGAQGTRRETGRPTLAGLVGEDQPGGLSEAWEQQCTFLSFFSFWILG